MLLIIICNTVEFSTGCQIAMLAQLPVKITEPFAASRCGRTGRSSASMRKQNEKHVDAGPLLRRTRLPHFGRQVSMSLGASHNELLKLCFVMGDNCRGFVLAA